MIDINKVLSPRKAYAEALIELGSQDKRIVVLDADLAKSTKTIEFGKKFPERFFDVGISEQDMMGTAAGLALSGKIVFASTFAIFATGRAWEQIRTSIAYPYLNVKIVATHGGIATGQDGVTHQATEDIALMRAIPGMRVLVPSDAYQTKMLVKKVAYIDGPFYIRLTRPSLPVIYKGIEEFEVGKSFILRDGEDVAIFAIGLLVGNALLAAEMLENEGISAAVIDAYSVKPIDRRTIIKYAKKTKLIVTCEDHTIIGGLGDAVGEVLLKEYPVYLLKIGIEDRFCESGTPEELYEKYGLTPESIANKIKSFVRKFQKVKV